MDDFEQALIAQYASKKILLTQADKPKREKEKATFVGQENYVFEAMLVEACENSKNLQIKDLGSYEPTLANMDKFGIIDLVQASSVMTLSSVQLLTHAWSLLHSKTSSLLDTMMFLFVVPSTHESLQKHMD